MVSRYTDEAIPRVRLPARLQEILVPAGGLRRPGALLAMTYALLVLSIISASAFAEGKEFPSKTIMDFNGSALVNNLGGEVGTWEKNPKDKSQFAAVSLSGKERLPPYGSSLKLEYSVKSSDDAANGVWTKLNGFDAFSYDHFEFWVKGDKGAGYTTVFKIAFSKTVADREGRDETVKGSYIVKGVTDKWQKVSIPLNVMNGIQDWRDLKEFAISIEKRRADNPKGILYFDDFAFVRTGEPGPKITDIVPHKKRKTEDPGDREEFVKFLISRLNGFPEEVFVKKSFPAEDREFLIAIAKDTWRYFDEIVDKEHNLPLDNIHLDEKAVVSMNTRIGDYTNVTNIGVYLMCVVSACDLGFISEEEALARLERTIDSIEKLEKHKGFPYNYYDITIFQRTSNFISFVDAGWLAAGIIVAKNAFPDSLASRCQELLDAMDFSFFYDPAEGLMYHGFYANIDYYSEYQYGAFYTESRAISYIAIGKKDVPKEHWFRMLRTFPESWPWQTQIPQDRREKKYLGYNVRGGYYEYEGLKFVPSWGGSMFEALMPALIMDEKSLSPNALGLNDKRHAEIQVKYALDELGYGVFGMSPSSVPGGRYSEYGVKPLGIKGYKPGVVTPHATFLALEFIPKEAIRNLRTMISKFNAYGEYGFYDAINASTGKVATAYLCLDQAMSLIAINNYLNDGAIRKRFHSDAIARNAEELIIVEDFFE